MKKGRLKEMQSFSTTSEIMFHFEEQRKLGKAIKTAKSIALNLEADFS